MSKYITVGTVSGFLALLAFVASVFGANELAQLLGSPELANSILQALQAIFTIVAAVGRGIGGK